MMTRFFAEVIVDLVSGRLLGPACLNEDQRVHKETRALKAIIAMAAVPFHLRLLPRALRAMIESRRYENALIERWHLSPHLLDDIGVVLGRAQNLPQHLIPAPIRLLELVAAAASEQVAAAELAFPPAVPEATISAASAIHPRIKRWGMAPAH